MHSFSFAFNTEMKPRKAHIRHGSKLTGPSLSLDYKRRQNVVYNDDLFGPVTVTDKDLYPVLSLCFCFLRKYFLYLEAKMLLLKSNMR